MGFNIRNEANLIIHHGNHLLARTFAQKHSAQKKPVRKTAVTAKKGCYSCQKDEQQKSCSQKDMQASCANQSRTQGGNL